MKIYTEEQIKRFIENNIIQDEFDLYLLTPIELPSDEEIEKQFTIKTGGDKRIYSHKILGAKWMRDKIQGGNK